MAYRPTRLSVWVVVVLLLQVVVRVRPIPKEREQCTEVVSQAVVRTTVPDNSVSYKLVGPQVRRPLSDLQPAAI